jgi:hypothetical protein
MARDLIPPPSPAGRPGSSAEAERERARELEEQRRKQKGGLWHRSPEDDATAHAGAGALAAADGSADGSSAARPAPADTPFRSRFGLVLGGLAGLAIATLAIGAAVFVGTTRDGVPEGWSGWRPTADDGVKAAAQIAGHVGAKYRLGDNSQLVGVEGGPLELDALGMNVPLEIAMRTAAQGGDIKFIEGKGLLYTLNGLGPDGAISGGKPSTERALLLRREALEIALYTFRYIDDVDLVVALLPPAIRVPVKQPGKKGAAAAAAAKPVKQTQALFFRPGDLEPQLEIPLAATIPPQTPKPETLAESEARRIEALTSNNMFGFSYQQGQNAKTYLVLDRLPE